MINYNDHIILENDKVRLEPLSMEHFVHLLPISTASPDLLQFSPSPFGSPELLKENIESALEGRKNQLRYPFAIFDKKHQKYVGSTSVGFISPKDARLEIGWTWLDKNTQGTGINRQCKLLLLTYAFDNLSMLRVEFRTDSRNLQSRRAIEKIGGIYEGTLRSHTVMLDGHRRDTVFYSILKNEWEKLRKISK